MDIIMFLQAIGCLYQPHQKTNHAHTNNNNNSYPDFNSHN